MTKWNEDDARDFTRRLSLAATGEVSWTEILEDIRIRFDGVTVALNTLMPSGSTCGGIVGVDPQTFEEYAAHWATTDPSRIALSHLAKAPGSIGRTHQVADFDRVVLHHDIYYHWMRPREFRHGLWLTTWSSEPGLSGMAIYRSPSMGPITDELFAFIERIAPDFIAALRVHHRIRAETDFHAGVQSALESRGGVVIRLDANARVVALSDKARWFIDHSGALMWGDTESTIVARNPRTRVELDRLIKEALTQDRSALLALPTTLRTLPFELMVMPTSRPVDGATGRQGVLLVVADPSAERDLSAVVLSQLHGFTPSEADLARGLARGLSLQEMADQKQLSKETLRCHLKGLFAKTDTRRQVDLVRTLTASVAAANPHEDTVALAHSGPLRHGSQAGRAAVGANTPHPDRGDEVHDP